MSFYCIFCRGFSCTFFRLCFSCGFFAVAISMLAFEGLFFCALISRSDFLCNLRLSLLRPFSCKVSFVRSFVGPDSMRFLQTLLRALFGSSFLTALLCNVFFISVSTSNFSVSFFAKLYWYALQLRIFCAPFSGHFYLRSFVGFS